MSAITSQSLLISRSGQFLKKRISRKQFWLSCVFPYGLLFFLAWLVNRQLSLGNFVYALAGLAWLLPAAVISIGRCHDRNRSGVWALGWLIPIVGQVWAVIEGGFFPGKDDLPDSQNRYGRNPIAPRPLAVRDKDIDVIEGPSSTPHNTVKKARPQVRDELRKDGWRLEITEPGFRPRVESIPSEALGSGAALVIGRASQSCHIQLQADRVSRKHAALSFLNQQLFLEDLGSSNGTFIQDGRRLEPHRIERLGSQAFKVGEAVLRVHAP
ncbi:MAG: FHA domain-containing protein [Verrucomicrobiota bacterium]